MIADLNRGAALNKKFVQEWWKRSGKDSPESAISIMAGATMVECINIAFWIAEVENYPDWLKTKVDCLIKFYGYKEIVNKSEGCPW